MEYWTFLVVFFGGDLEGYVATLPYRSAADCGAAIEVVEATMVGLDIEMVQCRESTTPSGSIRPLPRPEGLGNG